MVWVNVALRWDSNGIGSKKGNGRNKLVKINKFYKFGEVHSQKTEIHSSENLEH